MSAVPWAILLKRTFDVDIRRCVRCGGHVKVRAVIVNPAVAKRIVEVIDAKRARDPPLAGTAPSRA
jgi:hypothetical protein